VVEGRGRGPTDTVAAENFEFEISSDTDDICLFLYIINTLWFQAILLTTKTRWLIAQCEFSFITAAFALKKNFSCRKDIITSNFFFDLNTKIFSLFMHIKTVRTGKAFL
jgi:hypothetical protein